MQKFLKECLQAGGPYVQEDFMWQVVSCANIVDAMWKGGGLASSRIVFFRSFFRKQQENFVGTRNIFPESSSSKLFFLIL